MAARGSGVLHTWLWSGGLLDEPVQGPLDDPQYRPRDNYYTLLSPSTSPEVIAVGAIANRDLEFLADNYPGLFDDLKIGDLLPFSSRGPALDGLLKPDLVAPGVLTAAWSGDSTNYRTAAGTSVSAPVVAGAIALYFERHPEATNRDVWRALTESAASDEFTGETPNYDWGYGKLDVAAFLQEPPTVVAEEASDVRPAGFSLEQNYPNPFNGRTTITYELPKPGGVELTLYDLLGQPVRRLVSEYRGAGSHQVSWDGADDEGNPVASGVYLYRLKSGNLQRARRLVLGSLARTFTAAGPKFRNGRPKLFMRNFCISVLPTTHIYAYCINMRTTINVPDHLLRRAKAVASLQGKSLKVFVTEALEERVAGAAGGEFGSRRVQLPLVPSSNPGSVDPDPEAIAGLLEAEEVRVLTGR